MLADLKELHSAWPESAEVANSLGYTLLEMGKADEAAAHIEKALAQDPDNPAYLDSMGWLQYRSGNYARALAYLNLAEYFFEQERSFNLENSLHMADALLAEKKYALARLKLSRALVSQEKFPSGQDALFLERVEQRLKLIKEKEGSDG
jgi:tetratricopeptide (TPR) repeat protein